MMPAIKAVVNGIDISPLVIRFELNASLFDAIDGLTLAFNDGENQVTAGLNQGQTLSLRWGYDTADLDLFEGVITEINLDQDTVILQAADYSIGFNSLRISKTFVDETATNILKSILTLPGLILRIEESDLVYPLFPILNESAAAVLQKITKEVSAHSGFPQVFHTRLRNFTWQTLNSGSPPVYEFQTGKNIIRWIEGKELTTLIVPVFCGDIITIDQTNFLVEAARYCWNPGGRVHLRVQPV